MPDLIDISGFGMKFAYLGQSSTRKVMNVNTSMFRVAAVSAALLGLSMPALADFSGFYAPANWATSHLPDAVIDLGSIDVSSAPGSITLIGSDSRPFDPAPSALQFTRVAPAAGTFSFNWSYTTTDSGDPSDPTVKPPFFDPAFFMLNGQFPLTDNDGASTQSGFVSVPVNQGDVIGFRIDSFDNYGGNATLTISNFTAPIPEPASVVLMSLGLLGIGAVAARRRRLS